MPENAEVVHTLGPLVVAVAVKEITTVPVGSMSLALAPDLLNRMKPAGGDESTTQVRELFPGSVATTETLEGVPAPVGIATVTDPKYWGVPLVGVVLVTVKEYATGKVGTAVAGEMLAV